MYLCYIIKGSTGSTSCKAINNSFTQLGAVKTLRASRQLRAVQAVVSLVQSYCWSPKIWRYPLEFYCYHEYKQIYTLLRISTSG